MATAPARATRQRAAVAAALEAAESFRSAQEVFADLRADGGTIGLTTVYRALQAMADAGEVDVLVSADGETSYRRCGTSRHHHHLVCRSCGRTVEVEGPTVERWAREVASAHGFTDVSHTLEVFGDCGDCGPAG